MRKSVFRGLAVAALLAVGLAGCKTAAEIEAERVAAAQAEAARIAALTPPITVGDALGRDAAIYVSFTRDMAAMRGGFQDAASIQSALQRGAAYDPAQVSRGMIAYGAIVALQSPDFIQGVRAFAPHPEARQAMIAQIRRDPGYATQLPGAPQAADMVMNALRTDIEALGAAADSIENDAYAIQERFDPRRSWAVVHIADRDQRLEAARQAATRTMAASPDEAARLLSAARTGAGLDVVESRLREPPYPRAVERALGLAALAALGAAGDDAQGSVVDVQTDPVNESCLAMSKLNLYQCLAASRPSYEDMFCLGRHIVRDLATCARGAAMPAPVIRVGDVQDVTAPAPRITPAPFVVTPPAAPSAAPPPAVTTRDLNTRPPTGG